MSTASLAEVAQLKAKIAELEQQLSRQSETVQPSKNPVAQASESPPSTLTNEMVYVAHMSSEKQLQFLSFPRYFQELTGYSATQLTSSKRFWLDTIIHPEDRILVGHQFLALEPHKRVCLEYRLVRADGTTISVSDNIYAVPSHTDKAALIFYGAIAEITEHKVAEQVLAETLVETQVLYDVSRILTGITSVEEALSELLGVLNNSETLPPASSIMLYSIEVDENKMPILLERLAWIMADQQSLVPDLVKKINVGTDDRVSHWLREANAPLILTNIEATVDVAPDLRELYHQVGVKAAVLIPLAIAGRWVGLLQLCWPETQTFSEISRRIFQALRNQLSIALDNIRLFEQSQQRAVELVDLTKAMTKRATELEAVAQVSATATTILDVKRLLQEAVDLTKARFHLYHAHIYLLNEAKDTLTLTVGADDIGRQMVAEGREIPLNATQSLVARAAQNKQAVIVNDVRQDPGFLPHPVLPNTRSEMALPMILGDEVLGVLDVQSAEVDHFDENDERTQTTLAAQIAVALNNARLWEQTEGSLRQVQRLATIVENQRDFMGICDMDGHLIYVNPDGRTMLGLPPGVHDKATISILDFLNDDDAAILMNEGLAQAHKEGSWSGETTLRSLDENIIPVEQSITLNYDAAQQPYGFNLIMRNISERKIAEEERERLLAEVNATVTQFIHHEWFDYLGDRQERQWWVEQTQDGLSLNSHPEALTPWRIQAIKQGQTQLVPASANLKAGSENQNDAALVAPIPVRGEYLGSLSFESVDPDRVWNDDELALVEAVTEQLGLTLENLRLFEQTRMRARRERQIAELTQAIWASGEFELVMDTAIRLLGELFKVSRAIIKIGIGHQLTAYALKTALTINNGQADMAEESDLFEAIIEIGDDDLSLSAIEKDWVDIQDKISTNTFAYTPDGTVPAQEGWFPVMSEAINAGKLIQDPAAGTLLPSRATFVYLGVPLLLRDTIIGIIGLERPAEKPWTIDQIATIQAVSEQIGLALDAARLTRETARAAWRDHVVGETTKEVWLSSDIEAVMQAAISQLGQTLDASEIVIQLNENMDIDSTNH